MLRTEDGAVFTIEECQLSVKFDSNVNEFTGLKWGEPERRDHLRHPEVDRRIILRWIFRKWDEGVWIGSSWLKIGTGS